MVSSWSRAAWGEARESHQGLQPHQRVGPAALGRRPHQLQRGGRRVREHLREPGGGTRGSSHTGPNRGPRTRVLSAVARTGSLPGAAVCPLRRGPDPGSTLEPPVP